MPQKVIRWENPQNTTFVQKGISYYLQAIDSVTLICGIADSDNERMYIDIEITNHTDSMIFFDPKDAYYNFKYRSSIERVHAFDPEMEKVRYDVNHYGRIADQKNAAAVGGALLAVGTVALVASAASESSSTTESGKNAARFATQMSVATLDVGSQVVQNSLIMRSMNQTGVMSNVNRVFWSNVPFRRTHILPKESIRGTLLMPIYPNSSLIKLLIPVGNRNFEFGYDQKTYDRSSFGTNR
jgi:hypothetical protein